VTGPDDRRTPGETTDTPLRVLEHPLVLELRLNRPAVHNALDEETIARLTEVLLSIQEHPDGRRAVLLSAEGRSFCAGADLHYMTRIAALDEEENRRDARRLSGLFQAVRGCPILVIAKVQGAALGGGAGLAACADLVIASEKARFGFTEVRLGVIPATISPFVVERIGARRAGALFYTGEILDATEARRIGLVDRVASPAELDAAVDAVLHAVRDIAPGAAREARRLAARVAAMLPLFDDPRRDADLFASTAGDIARLRAAPEGREGMAAFLQKRPPSWAGGGPSDPTSAP